MLLSVSRESWQATNLSTTLLAACLLFLLIEGYWVNFGKKKCFRSIRWSWFFWLSITVFEEHQIWLFSWNPGHAAQKWHQFWVPEGRIDNPLYAKIQPSVEHFEFRYILTRLLTKKRTTINSFSLIQKCVYRVSPKYGNIWISHKRK